MMNDGIYMELFAVKNGVRYNAKIIDMKEVSTTLTNSLMDGIEKLWTDNEPKAETKNQCNHNWKYESTSCNPMDMCYKKRYVCTWCGEVKTEEEPMITTA